MTKIFVTEWERIFLWWPTHIRPGCWAWMRTVERRYHISEWIDDGVILDADTEYRDPAYSWANVVPLRPRGNVA